MEKVDNCQVVLYASLKNSDFDYVGVDALYGADHDFTDRLDAMGFQFVGDICSNQRIYLDDPDIEIPERKNTRGRPPKKCVADIEAIKVAGYEKS